MPSVVSAIGTANPENKFAQRDAAELVSKCLNTNPVETRLLKTVFRATGIEHRYSVLSDYSNTANEFDFFPKTADTAFPSTAERMKIYKDNALDLAIAAIENCLETLENFNIADITHLITVSCTGMYAPGIDIEIIQKLKLGTSTKRTAINFMGCYGAFNAIKVADAICRSEPDASVLIVCIEICTIHFQKSMELDNIVANAIFADGAAAALIQSKASQRKYFALENFHNDLLPQTSDKMAWQIGNNGFDIVLSNYVSDIIESGIATFTRDLLNKFGLSLPDIHFYAIHPGGIKILQACEAGLNISKKQNKYAYQVLRQYGNMSSATVLFVLKEILNDITSDDHAKNIFSCAFGPGLTLESMTLRTHCV